MTTMADPKVAELDLMLFFYVAHETADEARAGGLGFYRDLAKVRALQLLQSLLRCLLHL